MASAVFNAKITYTPGGGGTLTQSFAAIASYSAVSAGTIDIDDATPAATAFTIPFGGVNSDARGLVIKNNTPLDVGVRLNAVAADIYQLAPGGMVIHFAPVAAAGEQLTGAVITTTAITTGVHTVDYIVLGS